MDAQKIGKTIKHLRARRSLTQAALANALHITDKAVSKWERGESIPDISIVSKLAELLDVDVDNILEGNITFLEDAWQGVYIGNPVSVGGIHLGSMVFDKPLVYIILSYFMLAGIRNIQFYVNSQDAAVIQQVVAHGTQWGIEVKCFPLEADRSVTGNAMVIEGYPFVFGPNLTKFFQRAMSDPEKACLLAVQQGGGDESERIHFDNRLMVSSQGFEHCQYYRLPFLFLPHAYSSLLNQAKRLGLLRKRKHLFVVPMGRGMIASSLRSYEDLHNAASLLRIVQATSLQSLYDPFEIACNRHFLTYSSPSHDWH